MRDAGGPLLCPFLHHRDPVFGVPDHFGKSNHRVAPDAKAGVLKRDDIPARAGYDPERKAPFNKAINIFAEGTPR